MPDPNPKVGSSLEQAREAIQTLAEQPQVRQAYAHWEQAGKVLQDACWPNLSPQDRQQVQPLQQYVQNWHALSTTPALVALQESARPAPPCTTLSRPRR